MIDASRLVREARLHTALRMDEWAQTAGIGRATLGRIASRHIPNPGINTIAKAVAPTGVPLWVFIRAQEEGVSVDSLLTSKPEEEVLRECCAIT